LAHISEILTEYEGMIAPGRVTTPTTKTRAVVPELIAMAKDPSANFGTIMVDGVEKPAREYLLSLKAGRSNHRIVSNALMRYISINNLNVSDPRPAGTKAPKVRSTIDALMKKYLGKYIDAAGKEKNFDGSTGFATFYSSSIASTLLTGDASDPTDDELEAYRTRLNELKTADNKIPLSAYIEALAGVEKPSQGLIDYANVLNDNIVLEMAKETQEAARVAAKPPPQPKAPRGKKDAAKQTTETKDEKIVAEAKPTPEPVTETQDNLSSEKDDVSSELPQESNESLKEEQAPSENKPAKTSAAKAPAAKTVKNPAEKKPPAAKTPAAKTPAAKTAKK
jgi:hypothetical protein